MAIANRPLPTLTIFLSALALRAWAARELGGLSISSTPQLDSLEYLNWARDIAEHGLSWPAYPEHAPGYPYFAGALLALSGGSLMAIRIAQAVLGSITCVLTARIAAHTLTPRAFLPAGLLMAVYGPLLYIDTAILAEPLFVCLLVVSLNLAISAGENARRWLVCGLVLGAAAIVRPTGLAVAAAFVVTLFITSTRQARVRLAGAFGIGVALLTVPVVIQNWRTSGVPMIQAYGGMNVYLGNRPSGDGGARARLGGEWDRLEGEAGRHASTRADVDRYYLGKAFAEIAARPAAYAGLLLSKTAWALQDEELRDTHSYYFFVEQWPPLRFLPSFGWLLGLAVAGVMASRSADRAWLFAYGLAVMATIVFLVLGTRYRIPLVPVTAMFAGAGLAAMIEHARTKQWRTAGTLAAVALVAWALSEVRHDPASHDLSEEWAVTGLSHLQADRIEDAEAAYRHAIAQSDSSFAWDGLGLVLQRRQLRIEAREAFERALQINPENATAWLHLGLAFEYLGNPKRAIDAYGKAVAIAPARTDAREIYEGARRRYQ